MAEQSRHWMIALDTSDTLASLALAPSGIDCGAVGAETAWYAGRRQTTSVLAEVDHLLRLADVDVQELGAVAVTTGPGAFNALRVGISIAKGLAFAMDIPIFGIGTLDVAAQGMAHLGLPVRAFVVAGRGRVVVGDYRWVNGRLDLRGALAHRTFDELADGLLEPTVFAGELGEEARGALAEKPNVVLPPPSVSRRRAATLLDLATRRWRNDDPDDLLALEPIYIHSQPAGAARSEQNR